MAAAEVHETEMVRPVNKQEQIGNMAVAAVLHQTETVRQQVKKCTDEETRTKLINEFSTTTGKEALYSAARITETAANGLPSVTRSNDVDNQTTVETAPHEKKVIALALPSSIHLPIVIDVANGNKIRYAQPGEAGVLTITRITDMFADADNINLLGSFSIDSSSASQDLKMSRNEFLHLLAAHPNVLNGLAESDLPQEAQQIVDLNTANAKGEKVVLPDELDSQLEKAADSIGLVSREQMKKVLEQITPQGSEGRDQKIEQKITELFSNKPYIDPMELKPLLADFASITTPRSKEQIKKTVEELTAKARSLKELAEMAGTVDKGGDEYKQAIQDLRDTLSLIRSQQDELENYDAIHSLSVLFESIDSGKIAGSDISALLGAIASGNSDEQAKVLQRLEMTEEEKIKFSKRLHELGPQFLKLGGPLLLILILSLAAEGLKKGTK